VERRGREDRVDRLCDRERRAEVRLDELDPVSEPGEPAPGLVEHGRGAVQGDDATTRQPIREELRDAAAAAAGVEDTLVALELQPLEHRRTPARLRRGDRVVGLAVPIPRGRHLATMTGP
jgi:hypothetical protein